MVKIKGFLRGGKGKIGDFVLQKGEKATIMRANNGVANPQSAAQMAQRVSFGTVTNAAKKMLSVIGLSFYGISDGKLSRRKFVELNLPILKTEADRILTDVVTDPKCFYKGKDINQLIPNPYIISDGNLVLPEQLAVYRSGAGGITDSDLTVFPRAAVFSVEKTAHTVYANSWISGLFGCDTGNQVTIVSILSRDGESVPYDYTAGDNVTVNGVEVPAYDWVRFTRMFAPRLIFKQNPDIPSIDIVDDFDPGVLQDTVQSLVRGAIDIDKSNPALVEAFVTGITCTVAGNKFEFSLKPFTVQDLVTAEGWRVLAAGVIRSANVDGQWDFTRSQMVVGMELDTAGGPGDNQLYSGLMLGTAIYTYVGVADTGGKNFMTTGTPYDEMPQQA